MTKRTYRSRDDWRVLIEEQQSSGLSAAEFCRQQQINTKYYCKRKIEHMGFPDKSEVASSFVKIQPPIQTSSSDPIHLHYKNSRLQIPSNIDAVWLANFLELLP